MNIGFLINPYAGIGGSVALKGSDGEAVRGAALRAGAECKALARAETFLRFVRLPAERVSFLTYGGEMGEASLAQAGFSCHVLGKSVSSVSTADDTKEAVRRMVAEGIACLVFLGGDGTARDICEIVGESVPVVGVPAGVKMYSAVYAKTPSDAAEVVGLIMAGDEIPCQLAEVMDIDEDSVRQGHVSGALYGYMQVPHIPQHMQVRKSSGYHEEDSLWGAARDVAEEMESGVYYVVGPGTSTRFLFDVLQRRKTLLGVDVLLDGDVVKEDATYFDLKEMLAGQRYKIIVTVIGGQGCLFGRGNQQIGPDILRGLPKRDIIVIASREKLHSIAERALYNDTGDSELDRELAGYYRIRTGEGEESVFKCR